MALYVLGLGVQTSDNRTARRMSHRKCTHELEHEPYGVLAAVDIYLFARVLCSALSTFATMRMMMIGIEIGRLEHGPHSRILK